MKTWNSRRGGIISGLLAASVMVFLVLLLAGVVVTKSVRVRTTEGVRGRDVSIDTPGGRLAIRTRDNMDPGIVGVPVYPGARRTDDSGGANIEWRSHDGAEDKGFYVVGAEYRTRDSVRDVLAFYSKQLPNTLIVREINHGTTLEYRDGGIKRIISISDDRGETRIGVASIGGRESN